ncbi:methyltransferase [Angustibacter luteus]|uniref:Methyltransferase n=1 Tax=Angustibacter luteus TaxID=658456 RepID=A0ABW1JFL8_9ACTN
MTSTDELRAMVSGVRVSAALCVAAELGLSDLLVTGPRTVADLAAASRSDERTLRRLLRALATVGVYVERPDGMFAGTELSDGLRSDVPGSVRAMARTTADPAVWAAWGHLLHSVRTGRNAFEELHGVDVWTHRRENPQWNAIFNENMTVLSSLVADRVASAYDFSGCTSVVDVGGGQGVMLEAVLTRHPHLTGTVFDRAHVVASAPSQPAPAVAGRWSLVSGSFFDAVPPADAYLLKSVLHDWPDDACVAILRTCAEGLSEDGVVLVVERVLGRTGREVEGAFSDLNMLVLPGGQERTESEYAALFAAAGLTLVQVIDTGSAFPILEARRAG